MFPQVGGADGEQPPLKTAQKPRTHGEIGTHFLRNRPKPAGGVRRRSRGSRKRRRGRNSRHRSERTSVPCSNKFLKAHRDELGPIGKACEPMKVSKPGYCEHIRRRKLNAQIGRESLEGLVRDVFSRKVVGRSMSDRITEELAIGAIERAVDRDPPPERREPLRILVNVATPLIGKGAYDELRI